MSSSNTDNLGLCIWSSGDRVLREDFNTDNEIIDKYFSEHTADTSLHITDDERTQWNTASQCGIYFGNGNTSRTISLGCNFEPKCVAVFAMNRPGTYADFNNSRQYHFQGFASVSGCQTGIEFDSEAANITVSQDVSASYENEYTSLNQSGVSYFWAAFK
ncbi:MAG: hypothetical protein LUG95_07445 [Clostridiales bacterium]|nr:hypothetical protein [Clostridiales bacterium]